MNRAVNAQGQEIDESGSLVHRKADGSLDYPNGQTNPYDPVFYDSSMSSQDRDAQERLRAILAAQSANGNPVAQQQLQQGTAMANSTAQAIGQSTPGGSLIDRQMGIGNAQAHNNQVAAGQSNLLKAQGQQEGMGLMGQLLGNKLTGDLGQAQGAQATALGQTQLASQMGQAADARTAGRIGAVASALPIVGGVLSKSLPGPGQLAQPGSIQDEKAAGFSPGGQVDGHPKAAGDSPVNDTVKALLSPGEIVLPRSVSQAPDAPEAAARFVAAVHASRGSPSVHGGQWSGGPASMQAYTGAAPVAQHKDTFWDQLGQALSYPFTGKTKNDWAKQNAAANAVAADPNRVTNQGGQLDLGAYEQTRGQMQGLNDQLNNWAAGNGPTQATQLAQNANDANIQGALRAGAGQAGRTGGGPGDILAAASGRSQDIASGGAQQRLAESMQARNQQVAMLGGMRSQDVAAQDAQARAGAGLQAVQAGQSLADQANLDRYIGGAGQGIAAASTYDWTGNKKDPNALAHGGVVRAAYGYPEGYEPTALDQLFPPPAAPAPLQPPPKPVRTVDTSSGVPVVSYRSPEGTTQPDITAPVRGLDTTPRKLDFTPHGAAPAPGVASAAVAPKPGLPATSIPQVGFAGANPKYERQIDTATEQRKAALTSEGEVGGKLAQDTADELKKSAVAQAGVAAQEQKMQADYQAVRGEAQRKYDSLTRQYSDAKIDPGQYWASRGTGEKMLAAIGLALGSFSPDGINRSVGIINQAIDRDIDVQKANISKMGQAADQQGKLLGIMRQNFGDDSAALAATRATMLQQAQDQIKILETRAKDPQQRAQLAGMKAALDAEKATHAQTFDLQAKSEAAKVAEEGAKNAITMRGQDVELLKSGAAGGGKDKIIGEEVQNRFGNIQRNVGALRKMIESKGTNEYLGPHNAQMNQLLDEIAFDQARLEEPDTTKRPSPEAIAEIRQRLPNVERVGFDSTALAKLKSFEDLAQQRAVQAMKTRTSGAVPGGTGGQ